MSTFVEFQDYIQSILDYRIQEDPAWTLLIEDLNVNTPHFESFFHNLINKYTTLLPTPELAVLTDPLFYHMFVGMERIPELHNFWGHRSGELIDVWTQAGTRDIPDEYIDDLIALLQITTSSNNFVVQNVFNSVYLSPKLWNGLRSDIYRIVKEEEVQDNFLSIQFNFLLFRYATQIEHIEHIDDEKKTCHYELMCSGLYAIKPSLSELPSILKGVHNNALAWHTAIEVCAPRDPTIAGNWMKMLETFSSLRLEPKDQDAWKFWHSLSECVKYDASGQELLLCLSETQNEMASAFANGWSIVDALYEDHDRYEQAASIFNTSINPGVPLLGLPECS